MLQSMKYSIVAKLFAAQDSPFVVFRKEGDKYVLEVTDANLKVVVSHDCVDFFIDTEALCVKTKPDVYKFVATMYVLYKVLPFAFLLKRVIKKLIGVLK